jgi:hypothetical protein
MGIARFSMVVEEKYLTDIYITYCMKNLLRSEEFLLLILAVFLNTYLPYAWWLYWALFLTPDLSMIGYAINKRIGAACYNIVHHKGVAIVIYLAGIYLQSPALQFTGLLLLGHSAFDRVFGYGLKYADDFKHTHLGWIGKNTTE